jgi:hypothetical protein
MNCKQGKHPITCSLSHADSTPLFSRGLQKPVFEFKEYIQIYGKTSFLGHTFLSFCHLGCKNT